MRIAIVNDAVMVVESLRRILETSLEHQVAWIARNGAEAVEQCRRDKPDLILMDLIMPGMDGVETTRRIMAQTSCAILIVTATVQGNTAKVFEALGAGALDVVSTPVIGVAGDARGADVLLSKLRIIERLISSEKSLPVPPKPHAGSILNLPLIVIGASAGGPAALAVLLGSLPRDFPAAIVIVQHVDAEFAFSMAAWLNDQAALIVRTAREGDRPEAGAALLAGTNDHLVFLNSQKLGYSRVPTLGSYRPSVDVFFESVARYRKGPVIGVLLTGMGRDGAAGLKTLRECGAVTIAQDSASCVVYGMPKAAAEMNAATDILPLSEIASYLIKLCEQKNPQYAASSGLSPLLRG